MPRLMTGQLLLLQMLMPLASASSYRLCAVIRIIGHHQGIQMCARTWPLGCALGRDVSQARLIASGCCPTFAVVGAEK